MRNAMMVMSVMIFSLVSAREYHVAKNGSVGNDGSVNNPLLTVQAAALIGQPGDIITVHAGTYRERVNPPRGGTSNDQRITYRANPGEEVILTGSEIVKNWISETGNLWRVHLPNTFFGSFNPYSDTLYLIFRTFENGVLSIYLCSESVTPICRFFHSEHFQNLQL